MVIDGVNSHVNSHLRVIGHLDAKFASALKNIGCTDDSSEQNLFAGAPVSSSSHRKTCTYKLLAEYKKGGFKDVLNIDHSDSVLDVSGSPIMYTMCKEVSNDETCKKVPLDYFVEFQLLSQFLSSNYEAIMSKLTDATYSVDPGRDGKVKTEINVDISYLRNFQGKMTLDIPVYGNNLNTGSISDDSNQRVTCIQKSYFDEMSQHAEHLRTNPMPIDQSCLHATK